MSTISLLSSMTCSKSSLHFCSRVSPLWLCFIRTEDVQTLNSSRGFIIDRLAALVRSPAVPNADEWVVDVLDWLTVHGLFVVQKQSKKSSFSAVSSSLERAG